MSPQEQIIDLIQRSQKILIMPSAPPDGDSVGSSLALYLALKKLQKEVTVVCPEMVPDTYHFLPSTHVIGDRVVASKDFIITINTQKIKIENIKTLNEDDKVNIIITPANGRLTEGEVNFNYGPERYDLIITVDTGGVEQLGHLYSNHIDMFHQIPVINIDHHASNEHFGRINLVDIMAPSTTELLTPIFELMEKKTGQKLIDEDIATLLLAGIITDTGSFQNANTSPRAFDASAKLISYGARQQEIIQHIFKTKQLSTLKLWGRILTKMQTDEKFNIVWSVLTRKDFQDTASQENETGGIIDELLTNAPGSEIVLLLKERKEGVVTGSIRTTTSSIDASALAEKFGGGGHVQAAGFRVPGGNIEQVEEQVLKIFREYQAQRLGKPLEEEQNVMMPAMNMGIPKISPLLEKSFALSTPTSPVKPTAAIIRATPSSSQEKAILSKTPLKVEPLSKQSLKTQKVPPENPTKTQPAAQSPNSTSTPKESVANTSQSSGALSSPLSSSVSPSQSPTNLQPSSAKGFQFNSADGADENESPKEKNQEEEASQYKFGK